MRELKKYGLRRSRSGKVHPLLSGIVHVYEHTGVRLAKITFEECFVDAVGKALPQGVTQAHPAYLKILHMPGRKTWRVFAMYFKQEKGVLLWESPTIPHWAEPPSSS